MEHENIIKAQQCSDLLRRNLRAILSTENAILVCKYCDGEGHIEMDNNGPISDCPVCKGGLLTR